MVAVSEPSQPSYEELAGENAVLRGVAARLEARIAGLEARLNQNSKNWSKPASSDSPFVKPAPKSLCGRSGRSPGGQSGHPGTTLRQVAGPDHAVVHEPGPCAGCGGDLAAAPLMGVERRQVFDIPEPVVEVTPWSRSPSTRSARGAVPAGR